MRNTAGWQRAPDDRILEYLREEGPASTTTVATAPRIRAPRSVVTSRLYELAEAELIAPMSGVGRRMWILTGEARRYLRGELDASWQPHPRRTTWPIARIPE